MRALWTFLMQNKVWWIAPSVILLLLLLLIAWLGRGESGSMFAYSLF